MNRHTQQPGITGRRHYRPRHAEPTALILAPRVEDLVHPAHVADVAEAEALAVTRWRGLWQSWRGSEPPPGVRPTLRDRGAYETAIIAHEARQTALDAS